MKTKELIRQLQEADPSGELECSVCNEDIHCVYPEPAYWDGHQQVLDRDEKGEVIGAKWTSRGTKVVVRTLSIEDAIFDDPDLPVDLSEVGNDRKRLKYKDFVEKTRKEARQVIVDVEEWFNTLKK